jgi:hypothetical protein
MKVTWFIPTTWLNNLIPSSFYRHKIVKRYLYDRTEASIWIRCLQLIPYLEEYGVSCRVNEPEAEADIVVFVRWQDDIAYDVMQRQKDKGRKVVFDLCINYFDETGLYQGEYGVASKQVEETLRIVKLADVLTCGSEFIKGRASKFHSHTVYLPESIDMRHFHFKKPKSDFLKPVLTAVWSGQPCKAAELAETYQTLTKRNIPLAIISEKRPEIPGPYTFFHWSYNTFPEYILKGELCISPRRTDNPYDLGHSHFKIGVFMAQGVPAIASSLPSYIEVVNKTGGGRICDSKSAWEDTLDNVLENRQMLWEWSQSARCGMMEYSTESVTRKYLQLFESMCDSI